MAYKRTSPMPVPEGGSGAQSLTGVLTGNGTSAFTGNAVTQYNVLVAGASNAVSSITNGTTGQIFTANTGANPSWVSPSVVPGTYQTWTPVLNFGGTTTGITYSTQSGNYFQIGNLVMFQVYIVLSSIGSASGNASITGMPFNPASGILPDGFMQATSITYNSGFTYLHYNWLGPSTLILYEDGSGVAPQVLTNSNFVNTSAFQLVGWCTLA